MSFLTDFARVRSVRSAQPWLVASLFLVVAGCAADPGAPGGSSGFGGVGATGGVSAATGGSGAFGGTGGVGAFGGSGAVGGSGGVGISGTGGASGMDCGGDAYGAEPRQLDIYVVMDKSYSMIFPTDLWGPTTSALNQFFMSPQSAGIGAGIQYFAGECSVAFYETPEVPIAVLPGNAPALQTSMANQTPVLGTATTPALTGALTHARNRQIAMPDTKQIVLLVSDGEPAGCMSNIDNAAMAAANGFTGSPSIPVYVLGLGNVTNLNRIAQSGGTGNALLADPMNPQAVIDAMNAIRGQALPCDYGIPATTGTLDPRLVNVQHLIGGSTNTIFGVASANDCDATTGGWYYDDPITPSRVFACPATCAAFGNGGEVKVVVGCPTQKPPE